MCDQVILPNRPYKLGILDAHAAVTLMENIYDRRLIVTWTQLEDGRVEKEGWNHRSLRACEFPLCGNDETGGERYRSRRMNSVRRYGATQVALVPVEMQVSPVLHVPPLVGEAQQGCPAAPQL